MGRATTNAIWTTCTESSRTLDYNWERAADQSAIQDLFRRTHETALGTLPPALQAQIAVEIDQDIARNLSDAAGHYATAPNECYVLNDQEDQITGFAALVWRGDDTAEPKNVVVDDRHQGRGLGGIPLDQFEERARRQGHRRAVPWTYGHLGTALGIYRRRGWIEINLHGGGQNPDLDPMVLELALRISYSGHRGSEFPTIPCDSRRPTGTKSRLSTHHH